MGDKCWTFLRWYMISMGLDAVDGAAARYFDQESGFGAILDMITDRMTTLGLNCLLIACYPEKWYAFMGMIVLDISSHWLLYIATIMRQNEDPNAPQDRYQKAQLVPKTILRGQSYIVWTMRGGASLP